MAKQVQEWVCEKCGARYRVENVARMCELGHHGLDELIPVKVCFEPNGMNGSSFPSALEFSFTDISGRITTIRYRQE